MSNLIYRLPGPLPNLTLVCLMLFAVNTAQAETVRDPMQPPAFALEKFRLAKLKKNGLPPAKPSTVKKVSRKSLQLSSILIGKQRKVAIINDRMLVVGDKIGSAKLLSISKDRVQLSRSGKKIELRLQNDMSAIRKKSVESKL